MNDIYDLKIKNTNDGKESIDYNSLIKQYDYKLRDKEAILEGSLELSKDAPDMKIVQKAFQLIENYKTGEKETTKYIVNEQTLMARERNKKKNKPQQPIVKKVILGEKNVFIGAVLGFLFGALGLFYVSWKMALGFLVFTLVMIVILPVSLYALPFLGLGLGVFGVQKHNEALATI